MPGPALALILVTHNSAAWLPGFFTSWNAAVANAPQLDATTVETVIADSGSTDSTAGIARTVAPHATHLTCGHIGFGAAANRAAAVSTAPWLLLCNPDLTFPPDFAVAFLTPILANQPFGDSDAATSIENRKSKIENPPGPACFAPRLLNPDGTTQPSVGSLPAITKIVADQFRPRRRRKYTHPQPTSAATVDWATAACLLLPREAFLSVGGFDERFFLYMEEVDLQRRLAATGCPTRFIPQAAIMHHNSSAARPPQRDLQHYAARGLLRYFAKHGTASQLLAFRLLALLSLRLPPSEALASKARLLNTPTGP